MKAMLLLAMLICVSMQAQNVQQDAILLPIALEVALPGGNGSQWKTEIWVRNAGPAAVQLYLDCNVLCPPVMLEAGASLREPALFFGLDGQPPAAYLLTPTGQSNGLQVSLRIRDLSRQAQTWGTELPVVRASELRSERFGLLDVPLDTRFRQTLRIYSMTPAESQVTVTFFDLPPTGVGQPLATRVMSVTAAGEFFPGYAQILDFTSSIPELLGKERLYIEIVPDKSTPIWAFVSVTNNETQHVTTITPR